MPTELTIPEQQDRVWTMIEGTRICMLVTSDGARTRARPMSAIPDRDAHAIYFLTDASAHKDEDIARFPGVLLTFANEGKHDYVTIAGQASIGDDRAKIRELWSPFAQAWWDSPDDPAIRLITVIPADAEFWDAPGGPIATVKMLIAAATKAQPDMGDQGRVRL